MLFVIFCQSLHSCSLWLCGGGEFCWGKEWWSLVNHWVLRSLSGTKHTQLCVSLLSVCLNKWDTWSSFMRAFYMLMVEAFCRPTGTKEASRPSKNLPYWGCFLELPIGRGVTWTSSSQAPQLQVRGWRRTRDLPPEQNHVTQSSSHKDWKPSQNLRDDVFHSIYTPVKCASYNVFVCFSRMAQSYPAWTVTSDEINWSFTEAKAVMPLRRCILSGFKRPLR